MMYPRLPLHILRIIMLLPIQRVSPSISRQPLNGLQIAGTSSSHVSKFIPSLARPVSESASSFVSWLHTRSRQNGKIER